MEKTKYLGERERAVGEKTMAGVGGIWTVIRPPWWGWPRGEYQPLLADAPADFPPPLPYLPTQTEYGILKALEDINEDMQSEALRLQERADAVISALAENATVLVALNTGTMVAQGSHRRPLECLEGIGFTVFSTASFAVGFGYGVLVAHRKLKTLKRAVDILTKRQEEFMEDVDSFYAGFRARGLYIRSDIRFEVPVDSQYLAPTFGRRVLGLTQMRSPLGGFWRHYVNMIVGFSLGAFTHGILSPIVGSYLTCRG